METREQVFEQLIKAKLGVLRGTAMRILGSPADVDDAVQEALMTAWRKFAGFRGQSEIATWVTRILINVCYDMVYSCSNITPKSPNTSFPSASYCR